MNTHQLAIFCYVAKHLSISKAAQELHISQPAVSLQVKNLEQTYDVTLIERFGRGIRLTPLGEQIYQLIAPFYQTTLVDIESLLRQSTSIKIAGNYLMTQFVVPEILGQQRLLGKQDKILIESMSSLSALNQLKKGSCDLILISSSEPILVQSDFIITPLFDDDIVFLTGEQILPQDISTIIVSQSKQALLPTIRQNNQFAQLPTTIVAATQNALAAIQINPNSATLVSSRFIKYFDSDNAIIKTGIKSHFYAIYRQNTSKRRQIEVIVEALKGIDHQI